MTFANATYLWGLLGLLLPIAIHLWSRKKVKTVKVGSTKLLQASVPKQTSSIKLNELILLFLRLLTILLLVFILAEPSILRTKENSAINYLIEPSLMNDERMSSVLDTLPKEYVRIFDNGFPRWEDYDFSKLPRSTPYWQLAQQMHSIPADSIVVFSKGLMRGLKGKRPTVSANSRWIVLEPNTTNHKALDIIQKESYAQVLYASSNAAALSFEKDTISLDSDLIEIKPERDSVRLLTSSSKDWLVLKENSPIQIGIVNNDSLKEQVRYFRAAYRGISQFLNHPVEIDILENLNAINDDFDALISFDGNLPITQKTTVIIYKSDEFADELITKGPANNVFYLTKLLDAENIVIEHLPEKLLQLLSLNDGLEDTIHLNDLRTIAENELQPITAVEKQIKKTAGLFELTPWVWIFFILIIIVERILSKMRKQ